MLISCVLIIICSPDPTQCGFAVYNNSLYFGSNLSELFEFFISENNETRINGANNQWINWFGILNSGILNFECFSSKGWEYSYQNCLLFGQNYAPLTSDVKKYNYQRCDNIPNITLNKNNHANINNNNITLNCQLIELAVETSEVILFIVGCVFILIVTGIILRSIFRRCKWKKQPTQLFVKLKQITNEENIEIV